MKFSFKSACFLASVAGVGFVATINHAAAQSSEPPSAPTPAVSAPSARPSKIAVILFQQAVAQTNEGQRNFSSLQQKFAPKQAELKAQSDEIDSLKKQLQDSSATLSDADRANRTRTIDEKTKALQRVAEDDQNDFNQAMNDLYQALAQKVYGVVDAYAKQQGYTLVLDASNQQNSPILWVSPGDDITKAIIEAYNAKSGVAPPPATGASTPAPAPRSGTTVRRPSSTTTH